MRIGYDDNGLIRIPIKLGCGIYIRWWYNGWHYWLFTQGETFLVTEGENYFTLGTLKMKIGSRQLDQQQVNAIRSLANTREVYAITDYGWRTVRVDEGSFQVFNNMTGGYDLEFTIFIGARHISLTALSPRISIPIVPPDYAYCELPCIGDQIWMCANYDSNYPGSKVYNDDEANRAVYGGLYSWDQIMASGFVPAGWHIPTLTEWQTLITEAGGAAAAGGALKEIGNTHWSAPNTGAVDTYDFTALPGGYWNTVGAGFFTGINQYARFWTATPGAVGLAYYVRLAYDSAAATVAQMDKGHFASVRLIKDVSCPYTPIKYGILYNYYAVTDAREIANTGWHVPSAAEYITLRDLLGGALVAGGELKETGTIYWNAPNTGAVNSVLFNARGAGHRVTTGLFSQIMTNLFLATTDFGGGVWTTPTMYHNSASFITGASHIGETNGISVRLLKNITTLNNGETGLYQGNDGKIYRTICIGAQEWMADDLAETFYRDGTPIPEVQNAAAWAALITGARCYYDNDPTYM